MLQFIQEIHTYSVLYPSAYFGLLVLLASVVCPGWYKLGCLQTAAVCSPAPTLVPARPRFVFYRRGYAVVLQVSNLLILGSISASNNTIAATIAVKVT
jgi:hypothetical protein